MADQSKNISLSRMHLFEIWVATDGTDPQKSSAVLETILQAIPETKKVEPEYLKRRIFYTCKKLAGMWKKACRNKSRLVNRNHVWLKGNEIVQTNEDSVKPCTNVDKKPSLPRDRPRKSFDDCSKRSKRRRLAELAAHDTSTCNSLRNSAESGFSPPDSNAVLSLFVEAKLTKHQYLLIRSFVNEKTALAMFPSYQVI